MDLIEEEIYTYEDYEGDEPEFDHIDELHLQDVSDPEESWGDEEPSADSDYSFISDEDEVRCGLNDGSLPAMKKSESNNSEWEVVSLSSVISLSDYSVNSIAREILEREQDLSGMTEAVLDEKEGDVEPEFAIPQKKKKRRGLKKYKKNVNFGLIIFRKNGAEIALARKVKKDKHKGPMTIPYSYMKKGECPLDTAVRSFVDGTACTNFDRFASLPSLIQKHHKGQTGKMKTYLFFPTVVNCNLHFLQDQAKYQVEWYPTGVVCNANRHNKLDPIISEVANEALTILELHAASIPTLVDPETEELADMAHRDLLDYAREKNVAVTSSEVRDFLARNEEDLHKMFEDPTRAELAAMVRKMIMQLPSVHKDKDLEKVEVRAPSDALRLLDTFVAAHTDLIKGKTKWSKVNDLLLEHIEVLVDENVQRVLKDCGWDAAKQRFPKKGRDTRYAIYLSSMAGHSFATTV